MFSRKLHEMESSTPMQMNLHVTLNTSYEDALTRVTDALQAEGFGILTEIDVKDTMKKKLDVDFRRYKILGACNAPIAHRALTAVPAVGLLLPCNVTVAENDDGSVDVDIINPLMMAAFFDNPDMQKAASDAHEHLSRVASSLES